MAALLQQFSGNPLSTIIGQKIEKATDASLDNEDWALNMDICDMINDTDEGPRDAVRAIKKRLHQNAGKNHKVIMFTLTVLETCVKNCGKRFHLLVTNKDFIQDLVKLIGPKNDPPAALQEKVLNLIQTWSETFRHQSELNGVVQVYNELKSKDIEFPTSNLEGSVPIHTPRRIVPISQPPQHPSQHSVAGQSSKLISGQTARQMSRNQPPNPQTPIVFTPEQLAKLKSELDVVQENMKVFDEMLTELTPGQEEVNDSELLDDLNSTCMAMQKRIVELIERMADEELTVDLLRINDQLNNLFLCYKRFSKKRNFADTDQMKRENLSNVVPCLHVSQTGKPEETSLIDLGGPEDGNLPIADKMSSMKLGPVSPPQSAFNVTTGSSGGDVDFDSFAQARSSSIDDPKKPNDVVNPDQIQVSLGSSATNNQKEKIEEEDFREMEAWLKNQTSRSVPKEDSTDFDKFLAERANAVEKQPNLQPKVTNTSSHVYPPTPPKDPFV